MTAKKCHTAGTIEKLAGASAEHGIDLTGHTVYSSYRPWADFFLPQSIGIPCRIPRGCCVICALVAVPAPLDEQTAKDWALRLYSVPERKDKDEAGQNLHQ